MKEKKRGKGDMKTSWKNKLLTTAGEMFSG